MDFGLLMILAALVQQPPSPTAAASQGPPPAAPGSQAPPATDIWLARLTDTGIEQPINITNRPGYDNQPSFTPDGRGILFTRSTDTNSASGSPGARSPAASGGPRTDVYLYDFTSRNTAATQITDTPESEYSPTVTPDGQGITVIRVEPGPATFPGQQGVQRLWRFTRDGKNPTVVLKNVQPVGYHAWGPDGLLALFVLGKPNTLQVADSKTGRARVVARNIGRSIHRIPGRDTISVLHIEGDIRTIKELDLRTRRSKPLVRVLDSSEGDYAWTPGGAILMSNGKELLKWEGGEWTKLADLAALGLKGASRLAVSPDGKWLALVVPE